MFFLPIFLTNIKVFESNCIDNTIVSFQKELHFGIISDEFLSIFNEFKFDTKEGNEIFYKFKTYYENIFDNYYINAEFTNDKLICFELNGWQTEEYNKIINEILSQLQFNKTVIEEDEELVPLSTDCYFKDELKAEKF